MEFEEPELSSSNPSNDGKAGNNESDDRTENFDEEKKTTIGFYGPQFIVNLDGKSLDLSTSDKKSVFSRPFDGGLNQQWLVQIDESGGAALRSKYNKAYVGLKSHNQGAAVVSMNHPFYWEISKDRGGYKLAVPESDLGLSLSNSAILRPLSEDQGTQLFILENTPENQEAIKNGKFVPWTSTKSQGFNAGTNINVTINDLAGAGNAANALKDLQDYFKSDGVKNIVISLGHHQVVNTSIPNWTTSFSSNLGTAPITGQECTGFPNGYFRIRLADTNRYWMLYGSKSGDGDFFYLVPPSQITAEQLFYLNPKGELCNRGANVDIMSSTLVIADNRPPTLPWPNPWSHSLPTFSYSKETKLITVKFYSDPWITPQWPRPESEWKDKKFIIAAETPTQTRIHGFDEIARWASPHSKLAWTTRGGSQFPAKHTYNVGVQEKPDIVTPEDAKKMQWDIEQV